MIEKRSPGALFLRRNIFDPIPSVISYFLSKKTVNLRDRRSFVFALEMEEVSESEDDDDEEGQGGDSAEVEAEFMKQEQARLEEEKQKLLANHNMIAEQKQQLLADMEKKASELGKRQKDHDALVNKIKVCLKFQCFGENWLGRIPIVITI